MLIGLFYLIRGIQWIASPYQPDPRYAQIEKTDIPEGKQLNVFINPHYMVGFDFENGELKYFTLDPDIVDSLQVEAKNMYIILDGYIVFENPPSDIHELRGTIRNELWGTGLSSNLTRRQLLSLWWRLRKDISFREMPSNALPENSVEQENLNIVVKNGTDISGLAQTASNWVQNMGGYVIEVSNASETTNRTIIGVYTPKEDSVTVDRLQDVFKDAEVTYVDLDSPSRFDIEIIVGADFITR